MLAWVAAVSDEISIHPMSGEQVLSTMGNFGSNAAPVGCV
jgi:hypothetical protein